MFNLTQYSKALNFVKTLSQLGLLMLIWWFGAIIKQWLNLPISAGVIGLFLLLIALMSGFFKMQWIKQGTDLILAELVLFFIPCVVGIIKYKNLLLEQGWQLILSVVLGTICVMVITAYSVHLGFKLERYLKRRQVSDSSNHSVKSK